MTEKTIPYPATVARQSFWLTLNDFVKRIFDIVVVSIGFLLIWPVFVVVGILIRRDSPGPIFYRGPRAGRYGKIFYILKFRTMYERPQSYAGPKVTAQDDPRVTPIGKWLRHTKLNELPQLWNVFLGDMSLVGPRPEDPDIAAGWPEEVRGEILSVPPGITSPTSVIYRNEEALLTSDKVMLTYLDTVLPSKLRLDQIYVRNRSLLLDLDTIFWTLMLLILRMTSYTPPEKMLFIGPITRLVRRHVSWLIIDSFITFAALLFAGLFWPDFDPFEMGLPLSLGVAAVFALLFGLTGAVFGIHRITWSGASAYDAFDLLFAAALAASLALVANRLAPQQLLPNGLIISASILAFLGFIAVRYRTRLLRGLAYQWGNRRFSTQLARERVLIIGGGTAGQFVAWLLSSFHNPTFYNLVGFVDDDTYKQDTRIRGLEVLGTCSDIPALVVDYDIGILVFAIHNITPVERKRILDHCAGTPARVIMIPDIMGAMNAIVMLDREEDANLLGEESTLIEANQGWPGISYPQIDRWLDELGKTAKAGDLPGLQDQIHALRMHIQSAGLYAFEANPEKDFSSSKFTLIDTDP
jgi:lipopolysaccharide/colanic/teichoic acid biosynthesis glycosyltransferase